MKHWLTIVTFVLLWSNSFGQESTFSSANQSYEEGLFEEAESAYSQLVAEGHQSVELFYNLGNTYYQLRELGKSIWAYEKALKIDPSNADAQFNLDFVNSQTKDQIDNDRPGIGSWFKGVFFGPRINLWAYLSLICSLLFSIMLVGFFRTRSARGKNLSLLFGSVFGLGLVFTFLIAYNQTSSIQDDSRAIIVSPEVDIKLSPLEEAVNSFQLHEGCKVSVVGTNENWVEVEVNGNSGWTMKEHLWKI